MKKTESYKTSTSSTVTISEVAASDINNSRSAVAEPVASTNLFPGNSRFLDAPITDHNNFLQRRRYSETVNPLTQLNPDGDGGNPESEASRRDALETSFRLIDEIDVNVISIPPQVQVDTELARVWGDGIERTRGDYQMLRAGLGTLYTDLQQNQLDRLRPFVHSMELERDFIRAGRRISINSAEPHSVLVSFFELFPTELLSLTISFLDLFPNGLWAPFGMAVFRFFTPLVYFIYNREIITNSDLHRVVTYTLRYVRRARVWAAARMAMPLRQTSIVNQGAILVRNLFALTAAEARSWSNFFRQNAWVLGGAGVSAFLGVFLSLSPDLRNWVLTQIFQVFVRPFNAASWFFAQPRSGLAVPSRESAESSLGFGRQILDLLKKFGAEFLELCAKEFRRSLEKK